jgi:hypothetical protein
MPSSTKVGPSPDEPVGGIEVLQVRLRMEDESVEAGAPRVRREGDSTSACPQPWPRARLEDGEALELRGRQTLIVDGPPPGRPYELTVAETGR